MGTHRFDIKRNVSLEARNTLRLRAAASIMFTAHNADDLSAFMKKYHSQDNFYLLGAGSNIFIEDSILNKPVLALGKEFSYIERLGPLRLGIGAASLLSKVISYTMEENLKGLEELVGIPATIGGMLAVNASSFGKKFTSLIESVTVVDKNGDIKRFSKNEIKSSYRYSSLRDYIVMSAVLKLGNDENVKDKVVWYLNKRMSAQDFAYPSPGCVFKNPPGVSAGYLIDRCGLKGFSVGKAQVSLKHGNFIINKGGAKASDIDYIIKVIKERVNDRFGVLLEEEIIRWRG